MDDQRHGGGDGAAQIDTVVIGGSAGSLEPLGHILSLLPDDFPATILVCQHRPATGYSMTTRILGRHARLPVVEAVDGADLAPGTVVVAAQDRHLMIGAEHVHLRRGAHENNFRPAIDPLFRSAAVYRGPRAVGVVLSGYLDDGAAGARALRRTGGRVLVQAPDSADAPDMPAAALAAVPEADVLEPEAIATVLTALAGAPCPPPGEVPWDIGLELKVAGLEDANMATEQQLGTLSPYNCPHCNGVLWQIDDGPLTRFRCHTGHGYTLASLDEAQEEALDRRLFDVLRAHRGRESLIRQMADKAASARTRESLVARAALIGEDAERLERIIRQRGAG
ncbi:putative protein-glutamate methyltransferase protein [Oceanicola granulosus HTCC2516]|uniref:protein-glutamate methylesterase n=1 Tax=Oceanicola granulosus (strain ATCC BAA-861 / DSM 15982 / KCTC 12143 / HTCC2516) TaxID=314256 RepID=Q2CCN8_OCEGH|nr:chemotaxis protein CheB [Oceanicola granulosus]EAR50475.1 putative protein-glutamate methyltransferase protein [Oceanicola granulosus HTCC2516]